VDFRPEVDHKMSEIVPRHTVDAPKEKIVADLLETGAVIVEGVLDTVLLGRFNAELDPLLAKVSPKRAYLNPAINFFYGDHVRQITSLASDSRIFGEEILPHPFYDEI
jgi:hypothetical protein